jgi:phosphoribosyl 1,2-cyclic phosphodiesterase
MPSSGPAFVRHGGNTPCVEVRGEGDALVVLDAGTGIVGLGRKLMAEGFGKGEGRVTLILSHCHPDHLLGLPFFPPVYLKGNFLRIRGISEGGPSLYMILEGMLNPCYSPLYSLKNLKADLDIADWGSGMLFEGGMSVEAHLVPHGRAVSSLVSITEKGKTLVYLPDVAYPDDAAVADLAKHIQGVHTLIHNAMYGPEEEGKARGYGHSTWRQAAQVARLSGAKRLVLFHHDPDRVDDEVDAMRAAVEAELRSQGSEIEVRPGSEGDQFEVG